MSTLINMDNYEAFYLDFLEGNLSEADCTALLLFLEQHPELQVEDDFLPALNFTAPSYELADFKQELKVFDDSEGISPVNCESFMIASIEGILNSEKQRELDRFLLDHAAFQTEYRLYQSTRLQADASLHYPNPASLKRGIVIPMYVKVFSAAASVACIFWLSQFMLPGNQDGTGSALASLNQHDWKFSHSVVHASSQRHASTEKEAVKPSQQTMQLAVNKSGNQVADQLLLPAKKIGQIPTNPIQFEPEELVLASVSMNPSLQEETFSSYLSLDEMKNPIKPITSELKSRFNKDIDFRTAKANKNKQGGFYLKIGRFEISRKTAPEGEALASN